MSRDEIAKMLGAIDRNTVAGKRTYAAMLLGTVLALRACDIAGMKLSAIDQIAGEIKVLQSKNIGDGCPSFNKRCWRGVKRLHS